MSEALIGVIIGGLLFPVSQGLGFLVTRFFKQQDDTREERRRALSELQNAILDLVSAEQAMLGAHQDAERRKADASQALAKRKIRLLAAKIDDEELWNLVHTPNPNRVREVFKEDHPGDPGDMYDDWNKRIRKLFSEVK